MSSFSEWVLAINEDVKVAFDKLNEHSKALGLHRKLDNAIIKQLKNHEFVIDHLLRHIICSSHTQIHPIDLGIIREKLGDNFGTFESIYQNYKPSGEKDDKQGVA